MVSLAYRLNYILVIYPFENRSWRCSEFVLSCVLHTHSVFRGGVPCLIVLLPFSWCRGSPAHSHPRRVLRSSLSVRPGEYLQINFPLRTSRSNPYSVFSGDVRHFISLPAFSNSREATLCFLPTISIIAKFYLFRPHSLAAPVFENPWKIKKHLKFLWSAVFIQLTK